MTAIMCVAEALSMVAFAAYATLLPLFQKEWSLTNTEAGLIGGIAFAGYMTAVPVLSALTDRVDSRRIYLGACGLSALGAAGFALFAQGFWSALFFQFVIGAGLGGTYMPGLKTLTDQLEGPAQARATAFYAACFGVGSSVSILLSGWLGARHGWPAAFILGATAPLIAAAMVNVLMPRGRTRAQPATTKLLDFRPVFAHRTTRYYIFGYALHSYELFAQRGWMVAFLVYSASLQPAGTVAGVLGAAALAAIINLCGPLMSVTGNELALRFGRTRIIFLFMCLSGLLACVLGFTAGLPSVVVFTLMCLHHALMLGDSAALTAGAIGSAPAERRGAVLGVYSFVGFSAALTGPLVFGVVLDLAGGNQSTLAWGLAFASIGIFGALAPVARALHAKVYKNL
ncbi:MAG: MFS transporter [Betaproteobacteria bacterium]|nr:MFS transporter [Betaproteobacteria bacterium]